MTAQGINSRQVYRTIKNLAQPLLSSLGFRPRGTSGLWIKAEGESSEFQILYQCDKYGWDWDGSQFTINFDLIDIGKRERPLRSCRYAKLLNQEDGQVWIALTNRVLAKLRRLEQPRLEDWETPEEREGLFEPVSNFSPADDPWLRCFDVDDIEMWWAEFLAPRMSDMLRRFSEMDHR